MYNTKRLFFIQQKKIICYFLNSGFVETNMFFIEDQFYLFILQIKIHLTIIETKHIFFKLYLKIFF
jgi:hypothetical protein